MRRRGAFAGRPLRRHDVRAIGRTPAPEARKPLAGVARVQHVQPARRAEHDGRHVARRRPCLGSRRAGAVRPASPSRRRCRRSPARERRAGRAARPGPASGRRRGRACAPWRAAAPRPSDCTNGVTSADGASPKRSPHRGASVEPDASSRTTAPRRRSRCGSRMSSGRADPSARRSVPVRASALRTTCRITRSYAGSVWCVCRSQSALARWISTSPVQRSPPISTVACEKSGPEARLRRPTSRTRTVSPSVVRIASRVKRPRPHACCTTASGIASRTALGSLRCSASGSAMRTEMRASPAATMWAGERVTDREGVFPSRDAHPGPV